MLALAVIVALVIWKVVGHQPRKLPKELKDKQIQMLYARTRAKGYLAALLGLALGVSLHMSPVIGPALDSGATQTADALFGHLDWHPRMPSLPTIGRSQPQPAACPSQHGKPDPTCVRRSAKGAASR